MCSAITPDPPRRAGFVHRFIAFDAGAVRDTLNNFHEARNKIRTYTQLKLKSRTLNLKKIYTGEFSKVNNIWVRIVKFTTAQIFFLFLV